VILLAYLVVGYAVAWRALPFSRNALLVLLLWPLPVAAWLVWLVTGKYPWWTPML
jgi:hypothetical protein